LRGARPTSRSGGTVRDQSGLQDAINDQIQAEIYSSYLYLSMSAYSDSANLKGFAKWMRAQANEETGHAMRFYTYLNDRGAECSSSYPAAAAEFQSPLDLFQQTLDHERK